MNYDSEINKLAEEISADKSIIQPWRNKAKARLEEVQAFVRMGKSSAYPTNTEPVCVCPVGGKRKDCPIHGFEVG